MLALRISRPILALFRVCFLTKQIRTPFTHPRNHTPAAELVATTRALSVASALQGLDGGVAVWAGFERFEGMERKSFGLSMDYFMALAILFAALAGVLEAVAGGADAEEAVLAGEEAAVALAIVGLGALEGVLAAGHAGVAFHRLFFLGVARRCQSRRLSVG